MPYIVGEDGVKRKYSCSTCIKGHRSSKCTHIQRELFEIKPKGRPVSQCTGCRELRKTKRVHIKCTCKNKGKQPTASSSSSSPSSSPHPSKVEASSSTSSLISPSGPLSSSEISISPIDNGTVQQQKRKQLLQDQQQQLQHQHRANSDSIMHVHGGMLRIRCSRCDRPQSGCVCTYDSNKRSAQFKAQDHQPSASSSSTSLSVDVNSSGSDGGNNNNNNYASEDVQTPLSSTSSYMSHESSSSTTTNSSNAASPSTYNILPPLRLGHSSSRSELPIPIHDPTDDIDSDTPIYKSEENAVPDREAVLGQLSHRSSEDLMKEIYGNFAGSSTKRRRRDGEGHSSHHLGKSQKHKQQQQCHVSSSSSSSVTKKSEGHHLQHKHHRKHQRVDELEHSGQDIERL